MLAILMKEIIDQINEELKNEKLTENERSVGESLVYMFENWSIIFSDASGNNKFNKNLVLHNIREMTSLTTKEIRNGMRRYKKIYKAIKDNFTTDNELLRIIDSSISKKLEIVKLQISLVKSEDSSESTSSVHLTDEDKELIQNMIKESEDEENGISYDV